VANIVGVTLNSDQFIPNLGLLSTSLSPALSDNRFRTGEDYLRLKGLPWKGQYWTFSAGDFRLPGQLLPSSFNNLYMPEIAGRGAWVAATHGERTFGFFYGQVTIANTPRVVLRMQVPQILGGFYYRQKIGTRLLVGARLMHFSNDLAALRKESNLLPQTDLERATTLTVNSLYTVAGPLKLFGEATWSMAQQDILAYATRSVPVSVLAGPIFTSRFLTVRANYALQNASYFPLLGSFLGDRQGPYGEVTLRPMRRLEFYGSASAYRNNVAEDPTVATFQNSSESGGFSVQLPAKVSLNAQITLLDLSTRANDASPWNTSKNQQDLAAVTKQFGRHSLRLAARDFKQTSISGYQRQRSAEIGDNFRVGHLTLGAGIRLQRSISNESFSSVFYRGSAQLSLKRFSLYANFETGNDLQNKTLFAANTVSTTIFGANLTVGKNWEFQLEAYRNNLVTALNPESIFVLQGQGVFIPGTLAALNQWSTYFRVSRRFHWGKGGALADLARYSLGQAPLKGTVEGFVMERLTSGDRPADGVPVVLDQDRTASTDAEGRFRFAGVAEGSHKVELALQELPAEFDPGKNTGNTILVYPSKLSRADFDVIRLASLQGKVSGPEGVAVDGIVIRMSPGDRYTTPDSDGNFYFYNVREGTYTLAVDEKSLPEFASMKQPDKFVVAVHPDGQPAAVSFGFQIHKPEKPIRKVLQKNSF